MRDPRAYGIELPKLALGLHRFEFAVRDAFFADRPNSPLTEAEVDIVAHVDKTSRHVEVRFVLTGWLGAYCDRCLRAYRELTAAEFRVIYTYERGLRQANDEEIIWIDRNTPFLDFSDELYEFVVLQLPMRRIPPDCPTPACLPILERIANATGDDEPAPEPPAHNPWAALEELRKKFTDN
jgi:uncharacterized metal-binding protein YceD (DUF177 family)